MAFIRDMSRRYWVAVVCFVLFGIYVASGLRLLSQSIIINYPDSDDYHSIVLQGMNTFDFWAGKRTLTTPLIWHYLATYAQDIRDTYASVPLFYTLFSFFCWGVFASSLACILRARWLKITAFTLILGLGLSRMLFFWNWTLLSESPFISFFVLSLGLALFLLKYLEKRPSPSFFQQGLIVIGLSPIIFLWSFTRDTNAYLGLVAAVLLGLLFLHRRVQPKLLVAGLAVAFIGVAFCQMATAKIGRRWQYPFVNVLGQRILTNPEYTQFFVDRGLPSTPEVMRFSGGWANSHEGDWSGLNDWLKKDGQSTYYKFLLSHPVYTLTEPIVHWQELIDGDVSPYGRSTVDNTWQNRGSRFIWPQGWWLGAVAIGAYVMFLLTLRGRFSDRYVLFSLALLLLVVPGLLIVWHGDAREVVRHSLGNSLHLRLGLLLLLLFSTDSVLKKRS